jgi:hypothetical protein
MPLNKSEGEYVEGLGGSFVVVPSDKWISTEFGKPHFEEAIKAATIAFKRSMQKFANPNDKIEIRRNNILVQEYHLLGKVAYIFEAKVGMEDMVYPYVFDIAPTLLRELTASGQWGKPVLN